MVGGEIELDFDVVVEADDGDAVADTHPTDEVDCRLFGLIERFPHAAAAIEEQRNGEALAALDGGTQVRDLLYLAVERDLDLGGREPQDRLRSVERAEVDRDVGELGDVDPLQTKCDLGQGRASEERGKEGREEERHARRAGPRSSGSAE